MAGPAEGRDPASRAFASESAGGSRIARDPARAIHVFAAATKAVDGRVKHGHETLYVPMVRMPDANAGIDASGGGTYAAGSRDRWEGSSMADAIDFYFDF